MRVAVCIKRCIFLGFLLALLSCAGGGTGGTGAPVASSGAVSGFGSVIVNGTAYDTSDAVITLNGQPGTEDDLRLGQVVTVRGTLDPGGATGSAETITFESNVDGPIDSIDLDSNCLVVDLGSNCLVVLGQFVAVNKTTQFGDTPFDDLMVGNIVQVSGFVDADGILRATRVDKTQDAFVPGIEIEASGVIANLNETHQTFNLNLLIVDYASAQLIDVPGNQLTNGQVVQVISSQNVMGGVLVADRVEVQSIGLPGDAGEIAELQGIITQVTSLTTFEISGQVVQITPDTLFEKGTADDIAVNVLVEVEGVFNDDGSILAQEVEFVAGVEFLGVITAVTSPTTFEVDGQVVRITPDTIIHEGAVDDIQVGRQVEVDGFFNPDDVLVATEIEFFLEGTVTVVTSATTFEINAQAVRLTPDTVFEGGTADDIVVGVQVSAEGFFDATDIFVATEIDFLP